jgi:hypothetical protein
MLFEIGPSPRVIIGLVARKQLIELANAGGEAVDLTLAPTPKDLIEHSTDTRSDGK